MRPVPALLLAAAALAADPAAASDWNAEIADEEGDVGSYAALAVDSLDRLVVAYRDERFRTLRIKRKTAGGWGHAVVPPDPDKNFGIWNAVTADDAGGFQVLYSGMPDYRLRHVAFDGVAWSTIEDVFIAGPYPDIELDSQGNAHAVFIDFPGNFPTYAVRNGAVWVTEFLEFPDVAAFTSLAFDSGDVPHVAYRRFGYAPPDALVLARRLPDGSWEKKDVVTDPPDDPFGLVLEIDAMDRIHIAYHDETLRTLTHVLLDGATATYTEVDSGNVGEYVSMAVDASLVPHIAYYDASNGDLRYVRGDDWTPVVIDAPGDVGQYASLALDAGGLPHVAYYDATNGNLRHAWVAPPTAAGPAERSGELLAVRPNPFGGGGGAEISFALPRSSLVALRVYDVRGRLVRTLLDGGLAAGTHPVRWDGAGDAGDELPAGVYFVRLRTGGGDARARVVKVR